MKPAIHFFCALLALAGLSHAEVPRKPLNSDYRSLWTDSPFTVKKVVTPGVQYNDLMDYVLLGVSPVSNGYRVTMINRKKPNDERLIIESERPNAENIKIMEVTRKSGDPLGTRVKIGRGSSTTAVIGFEDKFLQLKVAAAPPAQKPTQMPVLRPPVPTPTDGTGSVPRRRIVPPNPPTTQGSQKSPSTPQGGGTNNTNRGGFPGIRGEGR